MTAAAKKQYVCGVCDTVYSKWQGQCQSCQQWNSITEIIVQPTDKSKLSHPVLSSIDNVPVKLDEIDISTTLRIDTKDQEFNRVLGGGLVIGAVVLLSGEPGIGKSTLLLQLFLNVEKKVLYVAGEESVAQIKLRAERMKMASNNEHSWIITETKTDVLFHHFVDLSPEIIIIDSIQTLSSPVVEATAGSLSQIKQSTAELIKYAKEKAISIIIVGHINKEGSIAGPKVLEHMVDTVLHFEGDRHLLYRVLRTMKNRFGSTDELGLYTMSHEGLREISNPSELLITKKDKPYSGSAIAVTIEGNRPLLIEIQSLVTPASYATAQRSTIGCDIRRMHMLIAVLEKRMKIQMLKYDVFLNLTGGIKLVDPAIDLAASVAIFSSYNDLIVNALFCFCAEVGLTGELRPVARIEQRINEAHRIGFKRIYISSYEKLSQRHYPIEVKPMSSLVEILKNIFI